MEYIDAYISLTAKVNRRINSGSKILDIIVNSKFGEAKAKTLILPVMSAMLGIQESQILICAP